MIERVPEILDTLLKNSDEVAPVELMRSRDFVSNPPAAGELSELYNHFLESLDAATEKIAREWGPPVFSGAYGEDGYPPWSEAIALAYWERGEHYAFVAFCHLDHDTPLVLKVGIRRKDGAHASPS